MKSTQRPHKKMSAHIQKIYSVSDLNAGPRPETARSRSGSIEQQLDMNEKGPLRGDEISHHHGRPQERNETLPELTDELMEENFHVDMAEDGREGDEESGDAHSSGLQADDQQELQYDSADPEDSDSGAPGEMTEKAARLDPSQKGYRRRAA
jgi:hypothetical protein